jgi:alpha-galactosidase
MKNYAFPLLITFLSLNLCAQKIENVALTPPMGWNSWNCLRTSITEEKIKSIADAMVSTGMKDAGYEYIVIDDGWMTGERDQDGHIIIDSLKFPNGMKALADYIHSLGLKFGIYSSPGCYTCQKLMGSLGHEQIDANDYAEWGVDFLKYDWCGYPNTMKEAKLTSQKDCRSAFELMRDCLYKTGRPIVLSIHEKCAGFSRDRSDWVRSVANMHRTSEDIKDNWEQMLYCLETTADLWEIAGPGYWNDPDMLEVGNTVSEKLYGDISNKKMNLLEYQTHFSMWCMVAAPLIAGNDLRDMSDEIIQILTNKEVIAINQDPLGKQGRRIRDDGDLEVWCKELSGDRKAIALLNRSSEPADMEVTWKELGLKGKLKVRDLWKHQDLGKFKDSFKGEGILPHEARVLLIE